MTRVIGSTIITTGLLYGLIAFAAWAVYPGDWPESARVMFAFSWVPAYLIVILCPAWDGHL